MSDSLIVTTTPTRVDSSGEVTITNLGDQTVYYAANPNVSPTVNDGSLASGASLTPAGTVWLVVASDRGRLRTSTGSLVSAGSGTVKQYRPTLRDLGAINPFGVKLRMVDIVSGTTNDWYAFWGANYTTTIGQQYVDLAKQLGANCIRGVDNSPVFPDQASRDLHYANITDFLNRCQTAQLYVYWTLTGAGVGGTTQHPAALTAAEVAAESAILAALLDKYPNVVGMDVLNESNLLGAVPKSAGSLPDATTDAYFGTIMPALRAATSKPLGFSKFAQTTTGAATNSTSLYATNDAWWAAYARYGADFFDVHPYIGGNAADNTTDATPADFAPLIAAYPGMPILLGEIGANVSLSASANAARRMNAMRVLAEMKEIAGVGWFSLTAWFATNTGLVDGNFQETPNISYPFRTLPRRTVYGDQRSVPLVDPAAAAVALGTSMAAIGTSRHSLPLTAQGDVSCRAVAHVSGVNVGDVVNLQIVDSDVTSASGTATTTSGSTSLTAVTGTNWQNDMVVAGPGILPNTRIISGAGTATMVMSQKASASGTAVAITGAAVLSPAKASALALPLPAPATFTDSSASALTGQKIGSVTKVASPAGFGEAARFVPKGRITFPAIQITGAFTVECWFTRERFAVGLGGASPQGEYLVCRWLGGGSAANANYQIRIAPDDSIRCALFTGSTFHELVSASLIQDTSLHHVAQTYDGTTQRLFVDGVLRGSVGGAPSGSDTTTPVTIGADAAGASQFQGTIDEVRISNVARYTAAFTVPAAPFTSDVNTLLLAHLDDVSANNILRVESEWSYLPQIPRNAQAQIQNATALRGTIVSAAIESRAA